MLEVPRKFAKDSLQLLNRCTKPDKRGKFFSNTIIYPGRICKDCTGCGCWVCSDGIYRVRGKVDPHSHQQYHCVLEGLLSI